MRVVFYFKTMERIAGQDRRLFGRIEQLFYKIPLGRLRFRVMIDDDQYVTEPTLHIKPRSLVLDEFADGLLVTSGPYGLVTIQRDIIRPGDSVPVIIPGRPHRKPYIPLGELLQMSAN